MGTNYYLKANPPCPTCGHQEEERHIGKSSAGWVFALHIYPDEGIRDLPDWVDLWSKDGSAIEDEYGRGLTAEEMRLIITERSWNGKALDEQFHRENKSQDGPNGLARSMLHPHGKGTWDLHEGEFS